MTYWILAALLYTVAIYRTAYCFYYYHPERLVKHSPHLFDPLPLSESTYLAAPGTIHYLNFPQE